VQRLQDGSDVTGFGSFDNSTCKRVLDLLEPGDLRLGEVVIKRVADLVKKSEVFIKYEAEVSSRVSGVD